jgi:type II secretory pathway pseudopilin PulG
MRANRRSGFTLVETIAAIIMLAVAVPSMLWTIREAHAQRVNPLMVTTARFLAAEKIEDVIADRHSTTRGWAYMIPGNYTAESPVSGFTPFDRTVTLNEYQADLATADTDGGYMVVDVAVSWDDATGTTRTLTLSTVVTEYAP